ncbi:MAG: hypothetical protein KBC02_01705 [Candidatus Pacebacteria bacterium]|nr:hypothetical protein [Candidatus Paceibacterota bacterium]
MSEQPKTKSEQLSGESALRNIIEWSEEGSGQHNCLRIIADSLSEDLTYLLSRHGYEVVHFTDLKDPQELARLQGILIHAQSYMNRSILKKVAIIMSPQARTEAVQNADLQKDWSLNSQYMETIYL